MSLETTTEAPSGGYVTIAKDKWPSFFDAMTKLLENQRVEIEVISLELGDQIEAEWLPLAGLTYDRKAVAFYVYLEDGDRNFAHAIPEPREIIVRVGDRGMDQIAITDSAGRIQVVRLHEPLAIPMPAAST